MTRRFLAIRNGLACATLFTACFWISWPVAQMGFIDDWSFIKTAQVFARTAHLVYNGWSGPMLGWQVLWGALFIRLFGFSFMAVKLSILPIAIASVFCFTSLRSASESMTATPPSARSPSASRQCSCRWLPAS